MMIRKGLLVLALMLSAFTVRAELELLDSVYNYGTFHEESGKQTGAARLVNVGNEPTMINRVKTSCGCTVADYPDDEIMPGDTITVRFTFDPKGRPGRFTKLVKIYHGESNDMETVKITGVVIGNSNTLKVQYPIEAGGLRLDKNSIILGDVLKGRSRHEFVHGYNQSNDTLRPICRNVPPMLSVGVSEKEIAPGDVVTFSIYYNTVNEPNLGLNEYHFDILPVGEEHPEFQVGIDLTANVKADVSRLSPDEIKNAPMIYVENNVIDLGNITDKTKNIKASFNIKNEGKTELKINRIYSLNKSVTIKRMPLKLKPGENKDVEIEINPTMIEENVFNIRLEIVSDDPLHPTTLVRIVGTK